MSDASKGNQYCLGRKASDVTKRKLSVASTGKKPSDATKKKMSEAHTKRFAEKKARDMEAFSLFIEDGFVE